MTPTIAGRWQTRLLLMGTIGVLITVGFAYRFEDFVTPFIILGYVTLIGFFWDLLYNFLQTLRWDRDWPPIFFLFAAIVEALILWGVINAIFLWQLFGWETLPGVAPELTLGQFLAHYSTVWLTTFLILLGPMKIFFLEWRYRGGQWLG